MERNEIKSMFSKFLPASTDFEVEQLTSGHINQTYLVKNGQEHYVFQKLNTNIFKHLESIMQNMQAIAEHLTQKAYPHQLLAPISTKKGEVLVNGCWRLFHFFEDTQSFEKVQSAAQTFSAAQFISEFHTYLNGLKTEHIQAAIPGFLDFNMRRQHFEEAVQNSSAERLKTAHLEINFIQNHYFLLEKWDKLIAETPTRIIHADPKISNFLFRESAPEQIIALIDWDTFMNGPILYDFGDMVRSYTNLLNEDDPNPGKNFSIENYKALKNGFLFHLKDVLTPKEIDGMALAAKTVIYVQAMRFLTDYLNNDIYFAVHFPAQNLSRTKNQLNLLKETIHFLHNE